jgi:hypothetical protein
MAKLGKIVGSTLHARCGKSGSSRQAAGRYARAPLTCLRLAVILREQGYPPAWYGIGRRGKYQDQAFVLDQWSDRWVVYLTERGVKSDVRRHVSEDGACRDLLARLRGDAPR